MEWQFSNRAEAGRRLAARLTRYSDGPGVVVLGLARGGLPVAFEVAMALRAPLDVCLVRKLGVPGQEELAMGAVVSGGARIINEDVVGVLGIGEDVIAQEAADELAEIERREAALRDDRLPLELRDRTVLLVDDGLATGSSMRAAVVAARMQHAARIVVAVPVAPAETCDLLETEADEVVCLRTPDPFLAVGLWYADFSEVSDEEMRQLLHRARATASERVAAE